MPDDKPLSRRALLRTAARSAAAALLGGCLSLDPAPRRDPAPWSSLRFAHFGDLFLTGFEGALRGLPLADTLGRALSALERVASLRSLDFLLFSGNLVAGARPSDARVLTSFLRRIGRTWRVVAGPADVSGLPLARRDFLRLVDGHGPGPERPWWAWKAGRHARVVGLDTTAPGDPGTVVTEEQLAFLREQVDRHPDDLLIVLTHHPPLPWDDEALPRAYREQRSLDNAMQLRFVLEAGENVRLVLSGCRLRNAVRSSAGLHYVTTPSTAVYPAAFRELHVRGHALELLYHPLLSAAEERKARRELAATPRARDYNPRLPSTYADMVLGSASDRTAALALR